MSTSSFAHAVSAYAFPDPVVDATNQTVTGNTLNEDAYARYELRGDGKAYKKEGNSSANYNLVETWLSEGRSSDVWASRNGTLGGSADPLTVDNIPVEGVSRTNLSGDAEIGYTAEYLTEDNFDCTVTIYFYDAATGGNLLDTIVITLDCQANKL